jgi:hypothetical protein
LRGVQFACALFINEIHNCCYILYKQYILAKDVDMSQAQVSACGLLHKKRRITSGRASF